MKRRIHRDIQTRFIGLKTAASSLNSVHESGYCQV